MAKPKMTAKPQPQAMVMAKKSLSADRASGMAQKSKQKRRAVAVGKTMPC